jgi:phage-related protein
MYLNTYTHVGEGAEKPVRWWIIKKRPQEPSQTVQRHLGQALYAAQPCEEYPSTKALKGFGVRAVLEIVALHEGNTFRTVYTVRFRGAIYVLHAFQKKSKKGVSVSTSQKEIELVKQRLNAAERVREKGRTEVQKNSRIRVKAAATSFGTSSFPIRNGSSSKLDLRSKFTPLSKSAALRKSRREES